MQKARNAQLVFVGNCNARNSQEMGGYAFVSVLNLFETFGNTGNQIALGDGSTAVSIEKILHTFEGQPYF